ncbi:hypothetical protein VNI00_012282 [Paramarasmius palmivorus]|uniref:UvrD-like helicase ATP-binding domain-containing protein n=1 Tax=Paramarasmius palmivorus TaxID=297713 RepID=A0AAW0C4J0_9AGAR
MPGDASIAAPNIMPMKATLHFDNAEGFGDWKVYISSRANRDLRDARNRNPDLFRIIVKKIKELSKGHFSDDNQKRLNHSNVEIPIFEAKMTRDSRLVYQVDVVPEEGRETQTLKIYGIYTHAQLDKRLWSSLGNQLARKGKEYLERVRYRTRPLVTGDNVYYPASFPPLEDEKDTNEVESGMPSLPKEDMEEVHTLLVLEKYVPLTKDVISCLIANLDVSFVPQLSPEEQDIIKHGQSCYVLGRSGTGKTATMMWKMFGIELTHQDRRFSEAISRPRQVFITQSRSLATRVEESYAKLTKALTTHGKNLKQLKEIAAEQKDRIQHQTGLVDHDEEEDYRSSLPARFSQLRDEHFPLFVTFDKLCKLLEADARDREDPNSRKAPTGSLVDYDTFLGEYWPHFSQTLMKGLDPSLVFSEIMGVIKGSEEACRAPERYLSRSAYQNLSTRTQSTFATQRGRVYELFEQYMKQKKSNGDYDAADRTHKLLSALKDGLLHFIGRRFDYLYVDEVQDNLMIDAYLMRYLCRNPTGLFWAGDTAQTISVGSSFRFNELKSFLYREENFSEESPQAGEAVPPSMFELTVNFRSHAGILDCAHTVIELIVQFWPYSIDVLQRGRGVVGGIKPVFFRGWDQTNVRYEQFLFKATSGNYIEFGAKQCILVRNDAAREKLREHVGDIGLIMTLYESKGLEFDDVLLFDFFEDSTVDLSQWRVVLNLIPEKDRNFVSAPRFDDTQHAGVNTELKFLYVAITRARKNMWIVDRSGRGEPMRLLWSSRDQTEDCTPETDVPKLAVSSTPDEWAETALVLFDRRQYFHAMKCYERAEQPVQARIAEAYHLRVLARQLPKSMKKDEVAARQDAFRKVAKAFMGSAEEQEKTSKDRLTYYRLAAEALDEAGDHRRAAELFVQAEEYGTAATVYRQHGFFDQAVRVVKQYKARMPEEISESIMFVARLYYFKENKLKAASELFDTVDEQLEFCEDYDLDVAKASLLEAKGDLIGAAQLHIEEGRISDAISLLLKDKESEASQSKAAECILEGFWNLGLFGLSPERAAQDEQTKKLLSLSGKVNIAKLTVTQRNELAMFKAILGKESTTLRDLGLAFHKASQRSAALLCLDHCFIHFPAIKISSPSEITPILESFAIYTELLGDLAVKPDACNLSGVQRLLNLKMTTQNIFYIPSGSFLHTQVMRGRTRIQSSTEDGITVSNADLSACLQGTFKFRLRERIVTEDTACQQAKAFIAPCISFTVLGRCNRDCRRLHIEKNAMTIEWYNAQVRIYLQQILIVNSFPTLEGEGRAKLRRHWLDRFYETLYPAHYFLGNVPALNSALVPEARRGMQVVKYWCQDILNQTAPSQNDRNAHIYLTLIMRAVTITLTFDDGEDTGYLYNSPGIKSCNGIPLFIRLRRPDFSRDISQDFLCALQIRSKSSMRCGYHFINHIVTNKIAFDVSMLCDLVELTCAALIVSKARTPFQHMTMPRTWLATLFPKLDPSRKVDLVHPSEMVTLIGQLLKVVHFDFADYLLFEDTRLSKVPAMRHVFAARLCRALCLLGYNESCAGIQRPKILSILNSLKSPDPNFRPHALYAKYTEVRQWGEIARMIHNPDDASVSHMELMVTVCHHGEPRDKKGYRLILCKNPTDILLRLRQPKPFTSRLRAEAKEFVPAAQKAKEVAPAPALAATAEDSDDDMPPLQDISDSSESDDDDDEGSRATTQPTAAAAEGLAADVGEEEEVANTFQQPTEEQVGAAILIQRTYRLFRRQRQPSSSKNARVAEFYKAAFEALATIPWKTTSRRYKMLYLGALPHALVCLDVIDGWGKAQKARSKKKFTKGGHEDIEMNGKALTGIVQLLKTTRTLKAALEPTSKLHVGRDLVELKNRVRELEMLYNNLQNSHPGSGSLNEVQDDLSIVVGSVVVGPVKVQNKPKPELNYKVHKTRMEIVPDAGSSEDGDSSLLAARYQFSKGDKEGSTVNGGSKENDNDPGAPGRDEDVAMADSEGTGRAGMTSTTTSGGIKRAAMELLSQDEDMNDERGESESTSTSSAHAAQAEQPHPNKKFKITPKEDEIIRDPPCHKCKELEIPCIGNPSRTSCRQCFVRHWKCTISPPQAKNRKPKTNSISPLALQVLLDASGSGAGAEPRRQKQPAEVTSQASRHSSSTPTPSSALVQSQASAMKQGGAGTKRPGVSAKPYPSLPANAKRRTPRIAMPSPSFDQALRLHTMDKGKAPAKEPVPAQSSASSGPVRRAPRRSVRDSAPPVWRLDDENLDSVDKESRSVAGPIKGAPLAPSSTKTRPTPTIDTTSLPKPKSLHWDSDSSLSPLSSLSSRCPSPDFTNPPSNTSPPTSTSSPARPTFKLPNNAALPTIVSSFNTLAGLFYTIQSDIGDIKELTASTIGSHSALEWGVALDRLDRQDRMLRQQGTMIEKQSKIIDALMNNMKVLLGDRFVPSEYEFDIHDDVPSSDYRGSSLANDPGDTYPDARSGSYEPSEPFRQSPDDYAPSDVSHSARSSAEPEGNTSDAGSSQQSWFGAATSMTSVTSAGPSQERPPSITSTDSPPNLSPPPRKKRNRTQISRTFSPALDEGSPPPPTCSQPSQSSQSQTSSSQPKSPATSQSSQAKQTAENLDRPKFSVASWTPAKVNIDEEDEVMMDEDTRELSLNEGAGKNRVLS